MTAVSQKSLAKRGIRSKLKRYFIVFLLRSFSDDFDNGWPEPEELEAAMRSMETLDRAFSWLVYGQE